MTEEDIDKLQRAALRARKRQHRFLFCPKGEDGKPLLLITPRISRKRLSAIKKAAQIKTFIQGHVKGDEAGRLTFETEHAEAGLLMKKLATPLSVLAPGLKKARVIGPTGEIAAPRQPRRSTTARQPRAEERRDRTEGGRAERREREARHRAAVAERGRRRRITGPVSLVVSPSGVITRVEIRRPSFRKSTRDALLDRYPDLHDESGNLLPGHDRRHALAWEMMNLEICQSLTGTSLSDAARWLAKRGAAPAAEGLRPTAKAIWVHATDRFNDLDNLWVGPDDPNRNLGRLIPVLKRVMEEVRAGLDLEEHPVTRSLRAFDIPQMSKLVLDDPEVLRGWFFQALVDPELADREETRELLARAEALFQKLFPREDYY